MAVRCLHTIDNWSRAMKFILIVTVTALVQGGPRIQIGQLGEYATKASCERVAQEAEGAVRAGITSVYGSYSVAVEKRCVSVN